MKRFAWICLAASACTTTNSQDITTHGMYAELGARADGTGTTDVYATLFFGDPLSLDFVRLTGNDELVATYNGQDMVMTEIELLGTVSHDTTFQGDSEGAQFEIALLRTVDAGAPSSTVTLPAKLTIGAIATSASRAAPLTVTWSPAGTTDLMQWQADGDCIQHANGSITGDPGTLTIAAGTFLKRPGMTIADSCTVTVQISRLHMGSLDPHFGKGGTIYGEQRRKVTFTSQP